MEPQKYITVNREFILGLKEAYQKALKEKVTLFTYDGNEFVTSYAKYFLQYYAPKFDVKFE